jgi:diaminohydroxyphosphoribosylaminopyrimidine deaminase/5-amino-6-(5-phosphoribosylamino)uracil reductase
LDDPQLTCRGIKGGRDPLRIVIDSRLRTPPTAKIVAAAAESLAPTWIMTTSAAPQKRIRALQEAGAEIMIIEADERQVSIPGVIAALAEREITSLLLEGGPTLAGAFWRHGLIDRIVAFIAPKVLADPSALPMVVGPPASAMAQAIPLAQLQIRRMGNDVMVSGIPHRGGEHPCLPV